MRQYDWNDSTKVGNTAVECVRDFLASEAANQYWHPIKDVTSVEDNDAFQERDVDLLVLARVDSELVTLSIEVKGDLNHQTGNFFFETLSDVSRKTAGAFLATTAKWYFYYFLEPAELYLLPMKQARPWFLDNQSRFPERLTSSHRKGRTWQTAGRIVPIQVVMREVQGCISFVRRDGDWNPMCQP